MKTYTLILSLVLFISFNKVYAQQDWEKELSEDLVEIKENKMVIEDFALVKIDAEGFDPLSVQVKLYSEAPKNGLISRDTFVSLTSTYTYIFLISAFADSYEMPTSKFLEIFELEDLESLIGKPDLTMSFYFTDEGMQIEFVNTSTGKTNRITRTWKEIYQ